jgi:hypothetical protein
MSSPTLLPDPDQLHLLSLSADTTGIVLSVSSSADQAHCPVCQRPSPRVHSPLHAERGGSPLARYPCPGPIHTRCFFCDAAECERQIFTERMHGVVAPYARRTDRLSEWGTHVAFALGGEAGARLLRKLGMSLSGDSLLDYMRAFPVGERPTPRVLSVDDFALRRGRTYGTLLVDLERHQVVNLLPERTSMTIAAWLAEQPGIDVISRDRDGDYAQECRTGAPTAVQVADRFHLLHNLRAVVLRILTRHATLLAQVPAPGHSPPTLTRRRRDREPSRARTRAAMRTRFERIQAPYRQGLSKPAIARTQRMPCRRPPPHRADVPGARCPA